MTPRSRRARVRSADDAVRDREIRAAWEIEFLTLQEIAGRHGLSRERVRQILNGLGALSPAQQRELKRQNESAYLSSLRSDFEKSAYEIAKISAGRSEVLERLKLKFPELSRTQVEAMFRATGITVMKQRAAQDRFSDGQLRLAVYMCFGLQYELALASKDYSSFVSPEMREDVKVFAMESVFPRVIPVELALNAIGFFFSKLEEGGLDPFSHANYERVREQIWGANQVEQTPGASRWPPTQQTISKRLGGGFWSDATAALGFPPSQRNGRSRGGAASEPDLVWKVLETFVEHCKKNGLSASVANFDLWRKTESQSERQIPSSATVRKVTGSWSAAINQVQFQSPPQ